MSNFSIKFDRLLLNVIYTLLRDKSNIILLDYSTTIFENN